MLGWHDVKQAYRRSSLGPFWLTLGMAIQISAMGLVFGLIFKVQLDEYLPFLAISIIFWGLISTVISDGCTTFSSSEAMIKQLTLPHSHYVIRTVWKNIVIAAHNLAIVPIIFLLFWKLPAWPLIALVPGLTILVVNLTWVVLLLGMICARFRDTPQIVNSLLTIAFYITPVMWYPKLIGNTEIAHLLLGLNPLYHWIQIVRLPILGEWPTLENWALALLSAGTGWLVAMVTYRKYRQMIAYWV
jgi:lipopolysaccharide transport system permease protein